MALKKWIAQVDSSWSGATNWDTSTVPTSVDNVRFDNTSVKNCTIDVDATVTDFTVTSSYTGNISWAGKKFRCYNFADDGVGGDRDYGDGITMLGYTITATGMRVGANLGSVNASSCRLDFTEVPSKLSSYPDYFLDDYGCTFRSIRVATYCTCLGSKSTHVRGDGTLVTVANFNLAPNRTFYIEPTSSGNPFAYINGTLHGGSDMSVVIQNPGTIITTSIGYGGFSAIASGRFILTAAPNVDGTYVLYGGGMSIGPTGYASGSELHICAIENNSSVLFDTSGKVINTEELHIGSSNASAQFNAYFRNSTVTIKRYYGMTYNTSGNINFGTSSFIAFNPASIANVIVDWTHGTNHTVDPGTFSITGASCNMCIESYGQPFYNITHNGNIIGGFIARGNFTCNNLSTSALSPNGKYVGWDTSTSVITASGNVAIGSRSTINMVDSSLIMTGPNKSLTSSTTTTGGYVLSYVPPHGTLIIDNTGITFQDSDGMALKKLVLRDGASFRIWNGNDTTTIDNNFPLILGQDSTLTCEEVMHAIVLSRDGTFVDLPSSYKLNGTSKINFIFDTTGQLTRSIPDIVYLGSGSINYNVYSGDTTLVMSTDHTTSSGGFGIAATRRGSLTFNTNGYDIKCNAFTAGCSHALGKLTSYYGSSLIDCSTYSGALYNLGSTTQNFSTATFQVGTNFTHGSNHTIDPGTTLIRLGYSGNGILTTAEKSFYDVSTSVYQVTLTGNLLCNNLTVNANFASASYRITSLGNVLFNAVTTLGIGNIYMLGTNPTLYNAAYVSNVGCELVFDCTGDATLAFTYPGTLVSEYGSLSVGPSVHLTHTTAYTTKISSSFSSLFLDDNARYTLNSAYNTQFTYAGTGGYPFIFGPDTTWDGNGPIILEITGTTSPALIGGFNYLGTGSWIFRGGGINMNPMFRLAQDLNMGNASLAFNNNNGSTAYHMDVSTAGYSIKCGDFSITPGNGSNTYFFASTSDFSVASFTIPNGIQKMSAFLEQSNWVCDGSWAWGRLNVLSPGFSTVTFTGNGGISVDPAGAAGLFYDVTCNAPGKTRLLLSDMSFNRFNLINGNYDQINRTSWMLGDARFRGSGNLNFGERISFSHNTATFEIASTIGDITGSACDMTFTGAYPRIQMDHDATFERLYIPSFVSPYLNGSKTLNLCARTLPLRMDRTATLNVNAPLNLSLLVSGNPLSGVLTPYTITGDSTLSFDSTVASTVVSIPSMTWGQYLNLAMRNNTPGVTNTIQLTGDLTCDGLLLNNTNTGALIFTPQTYDINAQSISFGGSHASGTLITDFSSVNVRVDDVNTVLYDLGTNNIRFNKSKWTCTGNWKFRPSHNTLHAWDTVTFIGDGTITSNGEYFNWFYLNSESKTVVLADNLTCREYKYLSGNLNKNGKKFNIASDYTEILTTE